MKNMPDGGSAAVRKNISTGKPGKRKPKQKRKIIVPICLSRWAAFMSSKDNCAAAYFSGQ
jgi:hypothetical protein